MTDWTKVHILVVEDSPTQAMILSKQLQEKGVQTKVVKNGKEALSSLEAHLPTLIISDIMMPEINGFDLCKKIRAAPKTKALPIILYTALYDPHDVLNAIACGANYFLTKPSRPELILSFIEDFLCSKSQTEEIHNINFSFAGETCSVSADLNKVATLLLSTYGNAMEKNKALELAQRELKEKNIQLKLFNDQKNTFLGMAAHDLRNPLAVIKGFCELLEEDLTGKVEQDQLEMIQTMHHSTRHMLQIVNELLDVSAIESGKLKLDFTETNLKELFEKNITLNRNLAEKKEIKIQLEVDGQIPLITCDGKKIEQVLTNFITNAIKYSHPKTTITVNLSVQNDFFQFSVSDQGQGIPKKEQDKLFKTFSKTTVRTTAGETSTGLGLAIIKKIIAAHDGEISFESEEGKGSTFFAKIPIKPPKDT